MPRQIAFRAVTHAAEEGKPPTLSAVALAFYPTSLPVQLGVLATVLLVTGIVVALMRRQGLVVVAFLAPLALFMLLRNKDLRYTLPLVTGAAAVAGLAVRACGPRLRGVALAVMAVVGGLQISAGGWAVPAPVTLPGLGTPWVLASPPAGGDWRQRDFLRIIVQDRAGRPAMVSVVPNDNYFSVSNFRYYAVRDELPLRFTRPWEGEPLGIDYMILKTGDQGPDFSTSASSPPTSSSTRMRSRPDAQNCWTWDASGSSRWRSRQPICRPSWPGSRVSAARASSSCRARSTSWWSSPGPTSPPACAWCRPPTGRSRSPSTGRGSAGCRCPGCSSTGWYATTIRRRRSRTACPSRWRARGSA